MPFAEFHKRRIELNPTVDRHDLGDKPTNQIGSIHFIQQSGEYIAGNFLWRIPELSVMSRLPVVNYGGGKSQAFLALYFALRI
ncbi:MAG: hypothetical protein IIC10_10620 [Proteobacteria bacterium]|nr:hypothetical protein [Pseudomonadota bacterium]